MIHATGLYRATPDESFDNIDTYQERIDGRAIVTSDENGTLLIRQEFAEMLVTLPCLLQEVSRRLNLLEGTGRRRRVGSGS